MRPSPSPTPPLPHSPPASTWPGRKAAVPAARPAPASAPSTPGSPASKARRRPVDLLAREQTTSAVKRHRRHLPAPSAPRPPHHLCSCSRGPQRTAPPGGHVRPLPAPPPGHSGAASPLAALPPPPSACASGRRHRPPRLHPALTPRLRRPHRRAAPGLNPEARRRRTDRRVVRSRRGRPEPEVELRTGWSAACAWAWGSRGCGIRGPLGRSGWSSRRRGEQVEDRRWLRSVGRHGSSWSAPRSGWGSEAPG